MELRKETQAPKTAVTYTDRLSSQEAQDRVELHLLDSSCRLQVWMMWGAACVPLPL